MSSSADLRDEFMAAETEDDINNLVANGLNFGTNFDVSNSIGRHATCLGYACAKGKIQVVQGLINHGADVNYVHHATRSMAPIDYAAGKGFVSIVKLLIESGSHHHNAIHWAATYGWVDVMEYLLTTKPNLEVKNDEMSTALAIACKNSHAQIVDLLLKAGSNVHNESLSQFCTGTPISIVIDLNAGNIDDRLYIINQLVIYGADIFNKQEHDDWSLLYTALTNDEPKIVDLLISLGCDVNERISPHNSTYLMYSCAHNKVELTKILLAAGADRNLENDNGKKAINFAKNGKILALLQN
jgi:uncharacterized protein